MKTAYLILLACLAGVPSLALDVWIQKADFGGDARHRCTGFSIGARGYIGGGHINSGQDVYYQDYWEYDPATDSWTQIANYGGGLRYQSSAFTIGNIAYVGCGEDHLDNYTNDFWSYNPLTNVWTQVSSLPGEERRGAAAFAIDGIGYVGTGQAQSVAYKDDFYSYDPGTDTWTQLGNFPGQARTGGVTFINDSLGYMGTGHTWGAALKDFWQYNPMTDMWTQLADVSDTLRQDATGFAVNGKGYIGTGNNVSGSVNYNDFWEYDFTTGLWSPTHEFQGLKRRYMVSFVIGSIAYCGTGTNGTNFKDLWSFDPVLSVLDRALPNVSLKAYPNPSNDVTTIELHGLPNGFSSEDMELMITDILGRKSTAVRSFTGMTRLNKDELGSGLFVCTVLYRGQVISSTNIILSE